MAEAIDGVVHSLAEQIADGLFVTYLVGFYFEEYQVWPSDLAEVTEFASDYDIPFDASIVKMLRVEPASTQNQARVYFTIERPGADAPTTGRSVVTWTPDGKQTIRVSAQE